MEVGSNRPPSPDREGDKELDTGCPDGLVASRVLLLLSSNLEEIEYDKLHSSEIEAKIIHDFAVELGELFVKHGGIRRLIALWQFISRWGDKLDAFYETHKERYLIQ